MLTSPFADLPADDIFLEYTTVAREFRRRVLVLFLLVAVAFGMVARLIFNVSGDDSLLMCGGLALFIFIALPRTRFAYRFTQSGVDVAELSGDALQLHTLMPIIGAIAILAVLVFSLPAKTYAYVGISCALLMFGARRIFPPRTRLPRKHINWSDVRSITVESARRVFALQGAPTEEPLLVFCPVNAFTPTIALARQHLAGVVESQGILIR